MYLHKVLDGILQVRGHSLTPWQLIVLSTSIPSMEACTDSLPEGSLPDSLTTHPPLHLHSIHKGFAASSFQDYGGYLPEFFPDMTDAPRPQKPPRLRQALHFPPAASVHLPPVFIGEHCKCTRKSNFGSIWHWVQRWLWFKPRFFWDRLRCGQCNVVWIGTVEEGLLLATKEWPKSHQVVQKKVFSFNTTPTIIG